MLISNTVCDLRFSDHRSQMVEVMVSNSRLISIRTKLTCRPLTQAGMNQFFNTVSGINWDFIAINGTRPAEKVQQFIKLLEAAYDVSFPEKNYGVRSDQAHRITLFIEDFRRLRDQLSFLEELNRPYDHQDLSQVCKDFRRKYRAQVTEAKVRANDESIKK